MVQISSEAYKWLKNFLFSCVQSIMEKYPNVEVRVFRGGENVGK